jgi:hypothetical protein
VLKALKPRNLPPPLRRIRPWTREPFRGAHHAGAAPGVLGRVAVVGAGEHAGEPRRGDPPRGQRDDQEHQVSGVEVAVDAIAELDTIGQPVII